MEKKHKVKASMSVVELTKASTALTLEVFSYDTKIGTIEIGQGSIGWKGHNRKSFKKLNWTKFAEMMDELHYPEDE